jgi:hypothetical protein
MRRPEGFTFFPETGEKVAKMGAGMLMGLGPVQS